MAWVYEKTSQSLIAISIAVITSLAIGDIDILLALDFVGWAPTDCTIGGVKGVVGGGGVGSKTNQNCKLMNGSLPNILSTNTTSNIIYIL